MLRVVRQVKTILADQTDEGAKKTNIQNYSFNSFRICCAGVCSFSWEWRELKGKRNYFYFARELFSLSVLPKNNDGEYFTQNKDYTFFFVYPNLLKLTVEQSKYVRPLCYKFYEGKRNRCAYKNSIIRIWKYYFSLVLFLFWIFFSFD